MCRQFHDAYGQKIIVFRPASGGIGFVCRHDTIWLRSVTWRWKPTPLILTFMHTTGHPEADQYCNVARSRELLGLEYKGHFPGE